jgi:cellobiose-specific phosphotransferase system component IIA
MAEENKTKKKFNPWWVIMGIIIVVVLFYSLNEPSDNTSLSKEEQRLSQSVVDKSNVIRNCQYDIISYDNTQQYDLANEKINSCRITINEARTQLDTLLRQETDGNLKTEYQAMILNFQGASIDFDLTKNSIDMMTKNLTETEFKTKIDINKGLIIQYLDIINKLETQYSNTAFFKANYGTAEGKNQLVLAKTTYQKLLEQYNNMTIQ